MAIIKYKKIFIALSVLFVSVSLVIISVWGLRLGIDFTGGSLLEVEFRGKGNLPNTGDIRTALKEAGIDSVLIQTLQEGEIVEQNSASADKEVEGSLSTATSSKENAAASTAVDKSLSTVDRNKEPLALHTVRYLLRFKNVDEQMHQQILDKLGAITIKKEETKDKFGLIERRFDTIGPTVGAELRRKSLIALTTAILAIIAYIAWAFRKVSYPVSSWKYGVVAVTALLHDIIIPTGIFSALGHLRGVEIDSLFITALLTLMGFSVHDTIVVFDRIRDNLWHKKGGSFAEIVGQSISETITRSINTSLTTIFVLLTIFIWGGTTVHYFSLALILGILFGTYSSIFLASPLLVLWHELGSKK